jgi:hypothetical protein
LLPFAPGAPRPAVMSQFVIVTFWLAFKRTP